MIRTPLAAPLKPNIKALAKTMSFKILGHVIYNVSLPPTQKLVQFVLADFYNEGSGKAWPSQDTLCMLSGLSKATLNRALKELKDKGLLRSGKNTFLANTPTVSTE